MLYVLLFYYFTMDLQDTQDLKCAGLQTYNRLDVANLIYYDVGNVSQRSKDPKLLRPGDLSIVLVYRLGRMVGLG